MKLKYTEEALNKFAKYIIQQSRNNLTKQKKNLSGGLYESLDYELNVGPNSFSLSFLMEEYGQYIDVGVRGKKSSYIGLEYSTFKYTNKKPPMQPLADWAKKRNIRLRDEKGKFKKGNYRSIGFVLQRSIYEKGIKPSLFFTKPFMKAFEKLPDDLIERFALDIDDLFQYTK